MDVDQRMVEENDSDPPSGRTVEDGPEPLKTHMPGETSSDPHTDVAADKATTLQNREPVSNSGELNRR